MPLVQQLGQHAQRGGALLSRDRLIMDERVLVENRSQQSSNPYARSFSPNPTAGQASSAIGILPSLALASAIRLVLDYDFP